jgi:tartrate dehydrogenase/decarboxylase/D-malate dehydrogenase
LQTSDDRSYRIAVIPGDGIGHEVMLPALEVIDRASALFGFDIEATQFDWGCTWYEENGAMMPHDGIEILSRYDAILLGAVGRPGVPDHVSLWGLLVPIRQAFDQYVNLRPVRLLPGVDSPLKGRTPEELDFVIVRENTEGEYSTIGGRFQEGTDNEVVIQQSVFTRRGVDRVIRFSYELATQRSGLLASATKSNGIIHTMPFWDERFADIGSSYPGVETSQYHIDVLAAQMVMDPGRFDVIVASNLFGDILSDLGPAVAGGLGIAPSANLNPERDHPSMFEPVHGSAPDIAGRGIANPVAQIWSAALMLDHLGETAAADAITDAIETATAKPETRTGDLGGTATTESCGVAIAEHVASTGSGADEATG